MAPSPGACSTACSRTPRLTLAGISGTSAGALNAVALAAGWLAGGAPAARRSLDQLWREIAALARFSPLRAGGMSQMAADFAAQLLSPYQLNPLGLNPLRQILERLVDFERLRRERSLALFIAATDLRSARARIFRNVELSPDVVLASACLPQLHQAVAIDGEVYWDGGFVSNPPLLPLVEHCAARDLLLVQINPSPWSSCRPAPATSATGSARSCSASRSPPSARCSPSARAARARR